MKRLIVTGDDFGSSVPVNEAIEIAHRDGILSAASLMMGAAATDDAVARARQLPDLRVGLHIVLVQGRPLLPPDEIPILVDASGAFHEDLAAAGVRFFFLPDARRQIEAEVRAQFQAFVRTGLPLDHVNAHNHMHLHPTVLGIILKVGQDFGMRAVRLPYEAPLASARASERGLASAVVPAIGLAPWMTLMRARLALAKLRSNDRVFGLRDSGGMHERVVLRQLDQLPDGVTEMFFHPATEPCHTEDGSVPPERPTEELAALTSPRVRRALDRLGIRPIGFSDLG
ncbi:MAG: hopanoid biosynthesis-associated protein HpnK [Alphaproteobacteria bacterium]|nr:hopanoid biosynthesis-associated protein HpnK [Alphaproteobacteria bacterium]